MPTPSIGLEGRPMPSGYLLYPDPDTVVDRVEDPGG